jgi:hypothetical protein
MNKQLLGFMFLIVICLTMSACGPGQIIGPALKATSTATSTPTNTPKPTDTPTPTNTPVPTNTPLPTAILLVSADKPTGGGYIPEPWKGWLTVQVETGEYQIIGGATATEGSFLYGSEEELSKQSGALINIIGKSVVVLGGKSYTAGAKLLVTSSGEFIEIK